MIKQLREREQLIQRIQNLSDKEFFSVALQVFQYQYKYNAVYQKYVELLGIDVTNVNKIESIPFLPIELYKTQDISCFPKEMTEKVFRSSTTTGTTPSTHYIYDLHLYHMAVNQSFLKVSGHKSSSYQWIGLLPSYLERNDASLVEMVRWFNQQSDYSLDSPFFLDQYDELNQLLLRNKHLGIPTILIGVTFAVLEWIKTVDFDCDHIDLIETGGMKGRRKEMIRSELHSIINERVSLKSISSEYGMTELMSQAYWKGGEFVSPIHMKVLGRDITDPLSTHPLSRSVALNIIDLYNIDSCSFIATDDIGEIYSTQHFDVKGRLDISDVRGCNLMVL